MGLKLTNKEKEIYLQLLGWRTFPSKISYTIFWMAPEDCVSDRPNIGAITFYTFDEAYAKANNK